MLLRSESKPPRKAVFSAIFGRLACKLLILGSRIGDIFLAFVGIVIVGIAAAAGIFWIGAGFVGIAERRPVLDKSLRAAFRREVEGADVEPNRSVCDPRQARDVFFGVV